MDPERFSDALLSFGVPGQASLSVAFGYRILPTLMEEFQQIFLSYRLRGKAPTSHRVSILAFDLLFYEDTRHVLLSAHSEWCKEIEDDGGGIGNKGL